MAAGGWFATGMIRFARSRQESARSKCKGEGPRSCRCFGRARSLHVEHLAQMGAAHQEPRRPAGCSLSARDSRRRFPGGPRRPARPGRAQPFRGCDRAPQERMRGRISTMAEARLVGAPLRLRLGGRRLFAGAHGAAGRMHAGADGRDARGQSFDKLRRSGSAFRPACGKAGKAGRSCSSICRRAAWSSRRKQPLAMARSGSGRPLTRRSRRPVISDAGCTRH